MTQKILIFLTLSFTGAGLYLAGTHALDRFTFFDPEVRQVVKKISAVKPKNFYSDRKTFRGAAADANENFTFFDVLNDPSMSKMVGLNGEVYKNYPSSPVKTGPEAVYQPKLISVAPIGVEKKDEEKALPLTPPSEVKKTVVHPKAEPVEAKTVESRKIVAADLRTFLSYVVQVSSFREFERAEALRSTLTNKGYASFIVKTELPDNKGTWHRVYIGRYLDRAGAESAAADFQREENLQAMVIRQAG